MAVALWLQLKCKFFNAGMDKEVCEAFEVWVKQLSKVLSGKKYLGGSGVKRSAEETQGPKLRLKRKKSV